MLLWAGLALLLGGFACFAIDRRAAEAFHAHINRRTEIVLHSTTDWAKGARWLAAACAAYAAALLLEWGFGSHRALSLLAETSLAFLASLAVASAILHTVKLFLGRRRPRDELELGLYGFRPFTFELQYDSFPSGHALTIFCVATILSAVLPALAVPWFAAATYLALTRALLNSHFPSDVLVGAAVGLIVSREVVINLFPMLAPAWF